MKPLIAQTVRALKACRPILCMILLSCGVRAQSHSTDSGFVAHEWGTFTSIAGNDGQAVVWRPLSLNDLSFDENAGPSGEQYHSKELPSFVETLHWGAFKSGLPATIRMETPVLYFYSSHAVTLSVQVKFAKGLITEWFPHASTPATKGGLEDAELYSRGAANGKISWEEITLEPGLAPDLPRDSADNGNRYYAARETLATPLRVNTPNGAQHEKFLFYRGVSLFPVPASATFTPEGKLWVRNLLKHDIPAVILFERRGEQVGYRIGGKLQDEMLLDPPQLNSTVDRLYSDLEGILVARGLYSEEAHAMLETWQNTWFEEGCRLFYIVPPAFVEGILPLSITPAPAQVARVFVGRLELVSPATERAVTAALAAADKATLTRYGRFLEPILSVIRAKNVTEFRPARWSLAEPGSVASAPSVDDYKNTSCKPDGCASPK